MKGDFTRFTFDRRKHYSGIRMQQGRVQLDADWNELGDIQTHRMRTASEDLIGPSGAPRRHPGFEIETVDDGANLSLSPGRIYVDGILCENEAEVAITRQPNLPGWELPTADGLYLAYLEVWNRHITVLEDPALREPGLGGADTATRVKTVWQAKLFRLGDVGMSAGPATDFPAWSSAVAPSTGTLRARAIGPASAQLRTCLYRVEVHSVDAGGGTIGIKWARDNATIVAPWRGQRGDQLEVESTGRGALEVEHGQWIELSDDGCELGARPGTLVRLIAPEGDLLTIDPETATGSVSFADFPGSPKIRRWDSEGETRLTPDGLAWIALEDGLEIQLGAGSYRPGDYWVIPARSFGGGIEWPRDGADPLAQAPHGIERHHARLALVELEEQRFSVREDCRFVFSALIDEVVQKAGGAPDAAIYIDGEGRVGIGTSKPSTTLEISGSLRLRDGGAVTEISSDGTLADNSDESLPTERAVKEYVDNLLAGSVAAFAMEEPPEGWLECDGQAVSRTEYSRLFSRIGTSFGVGNGESTFNVPDLRGRFVRGWAHGSSEDPDREARTTTGTGGTSGDRVGSGQSDALRYHTHHAHRHLIRIHTAAVPPWPFPGWDYGDPRWGVALHKGFWANSNSYDDSVIQSSGATSVASNSAQESRPRNLMLMYCIKH